MTAVTDDDTTSGQQMTVMLTRDLPAGIHMDMVVGLLTGTGSMQPLLQARPVYLTFDEADHDSNVLSMMTRLVTRRRRPDDLAGLREDCAHTWVHGAWAIGGRGPAAPAGTAAPPDPASRACRWWPQRRHWRGHLSCSCGCPV